MDTCPYCNAIDSTALIKTPDNNEFILISKNPNNSDIPIDGLTVKAFGCTKCGAITLGMQDIIGKEILK